jgi:predicted ATPase/class 3 adenylate cyclase
MERSTFGELLKRHRLAAGLSQEELAERAGVSRRGVSDLERGARTNPRPATTRLLADALGLAESERAAFLAAALANAPSDVRAEPATVPPARANPAEPNVAGLPSGTVTFLFTDIEGSTRLLHQLGERYSEVLGAQQRILRQAFAAHGGHEVDTQGDSFFAAFPTARGAIACAVEAQRALAAEPWPQGVQVRVRMGLHSGAPQLVGSRYVGLDVHRAARIAAAGHGEQVLVSAATAELIRHGLPEGTSLRDLGAHRLKDLQQADRVYQVVVPGLPSEFPTLKVLDARPHNLPVQPSPLVGREHEVVAVCALLRREDVQLVTLVGPGGVGKTRLSLQVAAEVLDAFPDGVWNVRLSRLTDPVLVVPTIAATLDLKESATVPVAEVLRNHLRDKALLLVLDNFEQVVAAGPSVGELLESCPALKLLVTSRVALHLRSEHEYALKPLALPDPAHLPPPDRLSQYAAVALFIERAQAAQADFALTNANAPAVAQICARLDGLPLAIELAAARVKMLPPPALLARLQKQLVVLTGGARDLDERQQTMRNTLAWSYGLLAPEEQRLFRRLAVFVGGCTLEAAETVWVVPEGAAPLVLDLLDGLSTLVDHSLVQQREVGGEPRFSMLYVIREFALEQLEASGEAEALRSAHAEYFVGFAEQQWEARNAAADAEEDRAAGERLEPEQDNLRATLSWLQAQARAPGHAERVGPRWAARERAVESPVIQGLRLAGALLWPWAYGGQLREGRTWLEEFLALDARSLEAAGDPIVLAEDASPAAGYGETVAAAAARGAFVRGRALYAVGVLAYWQGDSAQAVPPLEQALHILQAVGDRWVIPFALNNLAMALRDLGDFERARACYEQSITLFRALGENWPVGMPLGNLGALLLAAGDLEQAARISTEALAMNRQIQFHTGAAYDLIVQALIACRSGELGRAAALAQEALVLHHAARDERHYGDGLEACAIVYAAQGQTVLAARLLGAAATSRARIGMRRPMQAPTTADIEAGVAPARAALGERAWNAAFEAGKALSVEEAIAEALGEEEVRETERSGNG